MKKPSSGNTGQTINLAELIDDMPEEVLITLHNLIVNRLNMLQRQSTRKSMEDFRPGDVVSFLAEDGQTVTGVLVRLNKKNGDRPYRKRCPLECCATVIDQN